jgi:hypothetical protein
VKIRFFEEAIRSEIAKRSKVFEYEHGSFVEVAEGRVSIVCSRVSDRRDSCGVFVTASVVNSIVHDAALETLGNASERRSATAMYPATPSPLEIFGWGVSESTVVISSDEGVQISVATEIARFFFAAVVPVLAPFAKFDRWVQWARDPRRGSPFVRAIDEPVVQIVVLSIAKDFEAAKAVADNYRAELIAYGENIRDTKHVSFRNACDFMESKRKFALK